MRLCVIGKYPPIQGGVSSQTYWFTRAMAELGHVVHMVTNAEEVEQDYRLFLQRKDYERLECRFPSGGSVTLHGTCEPPAKGYIPYANPFVTKLAARAADVVQHERCDYIVTSYFEPYGLAGLLASQWTGVPFSIKHAGSDIGRLAQSFDRTRAYRELIRRSDLVICAGSMARPILQLGVSADRLRCNFGRYWPAEFNPGAPLLDVNGLLAEYGRAGQTAADTPKQHYDPSLPTVGMYGKLGAFKGAAEVIEALGRLARKGASFNLLLLCGAEGDQAEMLRGRLSSHDMGDRAFLLPFLPHWRVPEFLASCTAVCVLEHDFPVKLHQPSTPLEVLACGRCLIVSEEIREKQQGQFRYIADENCLIVDHPADIDKLCDVLANVIGDVARAEAIGRQGAAAFDRAFLRGDASVYQDFATALAETSEDRQTAMTLSQFQAVVGKVYTNRSFREDLRDGLERLDDLALTENERSTINELVLLGREVDRFAFDLLGKTFDHLWNRFPTIVSCFAETREAAFAAHCAHHDFVDRGWMGNIEQFSKLLGTLAATERDLAPCFADAIRYDLARLRAATSSDTDDDFGQINQLGQQRNRPHELSDEFLILYAARGLQIEQFGFDVTQLNQLAKPESIMPSNVLLAFIPSKRDLRGAVYRISPFVGTILDSARDGISIRSIISMAANLAGDVKWSDKDRKMVIAELEKLIARDLLI